jgi:hypothetical protein
MEHGARCRVQYTASSNSGLRRESLSSPQVHFGQPQAQAAAGRWRVFSVIAVAWLSALIRLRGFGTVSKPKSSCRVASEARANHDRPDVAGAAEGRRSLSF